MGNCTNWLGKYNLQICCRFLLVYLCKYWSLSTNRGFALLGKLSKAVQTRA